MIRHTPNLWVVFYKLNDLGERVEIDEKMSDIFRNTDTLRYSFSIQKSITSNPDTASVTIYNHWMLEEMYRNKYMFFSKFHENRYEVDILHYWVCGDYNNPNGVDHVHCIYSGELDDINPSSSGGITDSSLSFTSTAGKTLLQREVVNRKFSAGATYRDVVDDIFTNLNGYALMTLDDPFNKMNKPLPKDRTFHGKAETLLNSIATDLDMTWGLDCNPWKANNFNAEWQNPKRAYWVDKRSIFDSYGNAGVGPFDVNGSTGKKGLINYSKSQVTFEHANDVRLNIGRSYVVSDIGTMNDATEFRVRLNRLTMSESGSSCEGSYISPVEGVILEKDKAGNGAYIL